MTTASGPRRVVDRRLLSLGRPVRWFLVGSIALGAVSAALTIGRAVVLGRIIARAFHGATSRELAGLTAALLVIAGLGAATAWCTEVAAHHSAARVISEMRRRVVRAGLHPDAASVAHGEFIVTAGSGIDSLDGYFARYLPNLALAALVPAAVVIGMIGFDIWSAVIVAATLPLIPLFAALIGSATRARVARRWDALGALGQGLLESLRALPTLKAFGRSHHRTADIAALADDNRRETMGVLRIAFLSAFALELAATISVAVVAVAIGLRVLNGDLELEPALIVLILAPEAYLPLRRLAAEFHPAADAMEVTARVFDLAPDRPLSLEPGRPPTGTRRAPAIALSDVTVVRPDRPEPILSGVDLDFEAGSWTVLRGPSGSGKSTVLMTIAGLILPMSGRVMFDGRQRPDGPAGRRRDIGWVPQDPHLFAGTVADNVRFSMPGATDDRVRAALESASAGFVFDLPNGMNTPIGERGVLLSAGQRARISLARALVCNPAVLLLDEPTAHLDAVTAAAIFEMLHALRPATTIVLAAHRAADGDLADHTVHLGSGQPSRSES